jgi:integral membrane sensor domain MASE1
MLLAQRTVGALLAHLVQTIPQHEAVVWPPPRLTYAALYAQAMNWLRVFGHAAASRMGHGGGQQRHTSAVQSEKWGDSVAG